MKARRRILGSILATGMVVLLFQAVALAEPVQIGGGTFKIDTENMQPNPADPDNPDASQVPVEPSSVYIVDDVAGTVTVRPGAKITLTGDASDYRIIVSGSADRVPGAENNTVEITLKGFQSDRAPQKTEGGSGSGTGGTTGSEGQDTSGTGGENQSGNDNPNGADTENEGQGSDTGNLDADESGNTSGTGVNARAKEDGGSAIALQDNAEVILYLEGTNEVKGGAGVAAIEVPEGNSLTIAQKEGSSSGRLTAVASGVDSDTIGSGAAIGGNAGQNSGSITINSGTIEAAVESDAQGSGAAIGGGANGSAGAITIKDGTVTATSRGDGAAIGGGSGKGASAITIENGTVTANASGNGAAIGGGSDGGSGAIVINNGTVAAHTTGNGAAIGGGTRGGGGTITIENGKVEATATGAGASIGGGNAGAGSTVTVTGGEVKADANIGGGEGATLQGSLTVRGTGTSVSLVKGSLSELVGGNITVEDGAEVLVEMDENVTVPRGQTLTIPAGVTLTIASGKTLTIEGKLEINGTINGKGELYCFKAEEGGVIGADKIDKSGGLKYTPPCPHRWPDGKWEKYTPTEHKKVCLDCGAIRTEPHKYDEAGVICIECNEWKDPKYIYLDEEKTLTVYKSFGGEEIETEYWKDTVSNAEEIVIMDGVQHIPEKAFGIFENVKHIYIPESIEDTVNGQTFSSKADKVTVYCPDKWIEAINPTEDTAAKFVFYKMDGETAVITKITDGGVDLNEGLINGKPIYFADGVLKDFPEVKHGHRLKVDDVDSSDKIDSSDNRRHSYTCAICEEQVKEKHRGGVATCIDKAVCEVCGDEYGRLDRNYHPNLEVFARQEATHLEDGNILYWYCSDCERYFSDSEATDRIKEKSTILKATKEHTPQQTEWLTDAVEHWHTCECGELIDVKPHSFEWVVDRVATETENGLRHERCSVCGFEKAPEEIPRLNQSNNTNQPSDGDSNNGNQNNGNQNNGNQNDGNQNNGDQNDGNQNNGNQNNGNQNGGTNTGTGSGTNTGTGTGTSTGTTVGSGNNTNTDNKTGSAGVVKTGDYATLFPWIALLIASGAGIVGVVVYKKVKSKKSEK